MEWVDDVSSAWERAIEAEKTLPGKRGCFVAS